MEISKTFVVGASPDVTWRFLTDPGRVAKCLPGATITEQLDERTHAGTIAMKVGPVTATFKGTLRFERMDAATHTAEIVAAGQDVKGKGGADMRMTSRLLERAPGETEVTITSNVNVVGVLAQFGRGIIQDVSDQVFDKFVGAVRAELETPATAVAAASGHGASAAASRVAVLPQPPAVAASPAASTAAPGASLDTPASQTAAPIDVLSTASGVIGRAAGRSVRRPIVWVAILLVLFLIYFVFSR
jgi:carbon monoxide dehydrogenase subunit G